MMHEDNPKSIKYYVKNFLNREGNRFKGKSIVDFPAGNGVTSAIIESIGAKALPYDLFPEYFSVDTLTCKRVNINEGIPLDDETVDAVLSQEGIEHFENQLGMLKEFNRILKLGGSLIITTPNSSNMVGRLSLFLAENERFNKSMPPNELDDIWMSNEDITDEIYYGHIFLIGINKLRLLAKLSGFSIKSIEKTKRKNTALLLMLLFYPFILLSNLKSYQRNLRRNKKVSMKVKKKVYGEVLRLAISPRILLGSHLFVEFTKDCSTSEVKKTLHNQHKIFGTT